MAHGDYDCCAICDSKLSPSRDPETKAEICPYCIKALWKAGVTFGDEIIIGVYDLLEWINKTESKEVRRILEECGYRFCYYNNDIDQALSTKLSGDPKGWPGGHLLREWVIEKENENDD